MGGRERDHLVARGVDQSLVGLNGLCPFLLRQQFASHVKMLRCGRDSPESTTCVRRGSSTPAGANVPRLAASRALAQQRAIRSAAILGHSR